VRRVIESRGDGNTAQREVAREHRRRGDHDGEWPAPIERSVRHHAEDVGREAVAGQGDAVAASECSHDGERQGLLEGVQAEGSLSGSERHHGSGDRHDGAERDESPYHQARRRFETGEGTHRGARSKVEPLARRVKRGYRSHMRVTIEYCVV
jgi:hypothetical protein